MGNLVGGAGTYESRKERDESLFFAAAHGDEEKLAEQIRVDGNWNHIAMEKGYDGATPTIAAVQDNAVGCLRLLLECSDIEYDRADNLGLTALHHAAILGHPECIEALLACGASPVKRAAKGGGKMAAHFAASHDQHICLRVLLRHEKVGVMLDALDDEDLTPMQIARRDGATECIAELNAAIEKRERAAELQTGGQGEKAQLLEAV